MNSFLPPFDDTVQLEQMASDPVSDFPSTNSDRELILPQEGDNNGDVKQEAREAVKYASPTRGYVTVGVLFCVNLLNYMDRFTVAGVLDKIRDYYTGIDTTMLGLLQTSFILSYMIFSPIFGFLGDRWIRKYIMAGGILFWSAVTLTGSFMGNFYWFLALRACVGIGEASYSTIAPTLIADLFAKDKRSKMLMFFYFAIPVGSGLGYILSANIASMTGHWQWALRVTPILGVICVCLILLLVPEPQRGLAEGGTHIASTSWTTDLKALSKNKSFMLSSGGFTCVAFVTGALAWWAPYYMTYAGQVRDGKADESKIGLVFGIITCAAGLVGVALGSETARRLKKRKFTNADPLVCAFGMLSCTPFLYFAIIVSRYNEIGTWILIFLGETMLCLNWAIVADMLLYVVIPPRRSTAEAFQILMSHTFGDAGSPYLIGQISTSLISSYSHNSQQFQQFITLQDALYIATFVSVIGGAFFLATSLFIDQDRARVQKAIGNSTADSDDDD